MVQLHPHRPPGLADGQRFVEPTVLHPQFVHQSQRLSGEIAKFGVASLGFQLSDDNNGDHYIVFVEPHQCSWVGQKHGRVEDEGPPGVRLHTLSSPDGDGAHRTSSGLQSKR